MPKETLQLKVKRIEELANKFPTESSLKDAATKARAELDKYDAQGANKDDISNAIEGLSANSGPLVDALHMPRTQTWADKMWSYVGMSLLALVFILLTVFLSYFVKEVGFAKLTTYEGTRPVLVIAAIVSTIAFGGALLLGSLFSSDGSFEDRFRHAREIFLVFSGIFGTVIGFYFGAGDSKESLAVDARMVDGSVVAHAVGGASPYRITVTYGPKSLTKSEETKSGWAQFTFDKGEVTSPLTVIVTDRKSAEARANIEGAKDDLNKDKQPAPGQKNADKAAPKG
jgi:hypothetical protein